MVRFFLVVLLFLSATSISAQCTKDFDRKGDRICVDGECVAPRETGNPVRKPAEAVYTVNDLNPAEKMEYDNKKLSIETRGQGFGGVGPVTVSVSTWTNWYAYEGFDKISEAQFFLITGHKEQAAVAKAKKSRSLRLWLGGLAAMAVGAGTMAVSFEVGLPIFAIGAVLTPIGGLGYSGNKFPYSTVATITDSYNRQLIADIIARRR